MNLRLNLLPPFKKNKLEYLTNFIWTKDILELVILTISFISIILIWSWIVLEQDFSNLVASAMALDRASYSYNQDVREINKLVKDVGLASQDYMQLTPKILELIALTPADIKIDSIDIDRHSQTLTISGTAQTRPALLNYQQVLDGVKWIGAIETPASQLFQKENINFEFKTAVKNFPPLRETKSGNNAPASADDGE